MNAVLPRVSIVTPSYNQARYLEATIQSVLAQDYPNVEYFVIDGGSTDGSVEIIRRYADRLAYWVSELDRGQSHAINKGWRRSTGEIMAYLNSDDTYERGAIALAVKAFQQHPSAELVYGDANIIDEEGRRVGKSVGAPLDYVRYVCEARSVIPQPSAFIRRTCMERVGWLDESLHLAMDFEYWLRISRVASPLYLPMTLSNYRMHRRSKAALKKRGMAREMLRIYEQLLLGDAVDPLLRPCRRQALANAYALAGELAFADHCPQETRRYLWQAFRTFPGSWRAERWLKWAISLGGRRAIRSSRRAFQRLTGQALL